jgi:hypothetical protein
LSRTVSLQFCSDNTCIITCNITQNSTGTVYTNYSKYGFIDFTAGWSRIRYNLNSGQILPSSFVNIINTTNNTSIPGVEYLALSGYGQLAVAGDGIVYYAPPLKSTLNVIDSIQVNFICFNGTLIFYDLDHVQPPGTSPSTNIGTSYITDSLQAYYDFSTYNDGETVIRDIKGNNDLHFNGYDRYTQYPFTGSGNGIWNCSGQSGWYNKNPGYFIFRQAFSAVTLYPVLIDLSKGFTIETLCQPTSTHNTYIGAPVTTIFAYFLSRGVNTIQLTFDQLNNVTPGLYVAPSSTNSPGVSSGYTNIGVPTSSLHPLNGCSSSGSPHFYHIVTTVTPPVGTTPANVKFYIDGSQFYTALLNSYPFNKAQYLGLGNIFGMNASGYDTGFQGYIGLARFYNKALSSSEVTTNYNSVKTNGNPYGVF